jgi:hypothetical protein
MTARRLAVAALAAALALPGAALAHKDHRPEKPKPKPKPPVSWVLKGTVTAYTAAAEGADGSITVEVTGANRRRGELRGTTQTFVLKPSTRVVLGDGTLDVGERVLVKLMVPRGTAVEDLDTFVPRQVVDPADAPADEPPATTT